MMEYDEDEDRYRDDELGFREMPREQYEALDSDAAWDYLKAQTDAEQRRTARLAKQRAIQRDAY